MKSHSRASWVYAADIDGDSDMDVLSRDGFQLNWYENLDGKAMFDSPNVITFEAQRQGQPVAVDFDRDGDVDVLSASFDDPLVWYENTDGEGSFDRSHVVSVDDVEDYIFADLDGDGDMDILSLARGCVEDGFGRVAAWYENNDGKSTFGPKNIISKDTHDANGVIASDIDGDGDLDVLSTNHFGPMVWYANTDGKGLFGEGKVVADRGWYGAYLDAADVDGDDDMDVLWVAAGSLGWSENTDGKGSFGPLKVISTGYTTRSGLTADVDGDGDIDILATNIQCINGVCVGDIRWYENTDGKGKFWRASVHNLGGRSG